MTNESSASILRKIQEMRDENAERHRLVQEQLTITSLAIDHLARNVFALHSHVKGLKTEVASTKAGISAIALAVDHHSNCLDPADSDHHGAVCVFETNT